MVAATQRRREQVPSARDAGGQDDAPAVGWAVGQPTPQLGFAGAAALDAKGQFAGMVALTAPVVASAGAMSVPMPQATLVSVDSIRKFLEAQNVAPTGGSSGSSGARASLVRVICVRR